MLWPEVVRGAGARVCRVHGSGSFGTRGPVHACRPRVRHRDVEDGRAGRSGRLRRSPCTSSPSGLGYTRPTGLRPCSHAGRAPATARPRRLPPGRPKPIRTSGKQSPGLSKRSAAATARCCARPAGSTRQQIGLSCCRNFPRARPPKRIGEPRLTGTRSGARSGWSVPRRHYSDPRHLDLSSGPFRGHDGGHGVGHAPCDTDRGGGVTSHPPMFPSRCSCVSS